MAAGKKSSKQAHAPVQARPHRPVRPDLMSSRAHIAASPRWTMGSRCEPPRANANVPGPGAYGVAECAVHAPRCRFGRSLRPKLYAVDDDGPGPGAYESPKATARAALVPRAGRAPLHEPVCPGPGTYTIGPAGRSPRYGFGTSPRDAANGTVENKSPGPATYNVADQKNGGSTRSPGWGFGTAKRAKPAPARKCDTPGPGAYDVPEPRKGYKFTQGARLDKPESKAKSPGPGTYFTATKPSAQGAAAYTIGKRLTRREEASRTPGPGEYVLEPKDKAKDGKGWSFGTGLREREATVMTPGPGDYESKDFRTRSTPVHKIATAKWVEPATHDTPGPGEYTLPPQDAGHAPSFAGRTESPSNARSTPGPGQYAAKPVDRTPCWGFGNSKRSQSADPTAKLSPGPGSYDPEGSLATIAQLAQGRRPASRGPSMTPRRPYKHERPETTGGYVSVQTQFGI